MISSQEICISSRRIQLSQITKFEHDMYVMFDIDVMVTEMSLTKYEFSGLLEQRLTGRPRALIRGSTNTRLGVI